MAITRRVTQVYAGPTAAGQILAPTINVGLGVPAAMAGTFSSGGIFGGDSLSNTTVYQGFRFVQAMDLSSRSRVTFGITANDLGRFQTETFANGGIRVVFQDAGGNWASFHVYGSDYNAFGTNANGEFGSFSGFGTEQPYWFVDKTRTPDQSSGTLNWATIAAVEVHFRPRSSGRMQGAIGRIMTTDDPLHTGAVSGATVFNDVRSAYATSSGGVWWMNFVSNTNPAFASGLAQASWYSQIGLEIGNGSTATTCAVSGVSWATWNTPEGFAAGGVQPGYPALLLSSPKIFRLNQSASDNVSFTDCSFSSFFDWGLEVTGSTAGACIFTRCQFWRYETFIAGHGQYIDCQFNGASAPVEVNGTTVILDGVIRDATTTALKANTGPAIYDDLRLRFNNPTATADIELGSGGAGTYELPNVSVPDGYTLKIRNNSATNAITVAIPTGITFSTSTAGGTITVTTPSVTLDGTITNIFPGSRLQVFNVTKNTEVFNGIISGTTYSNTYVEGTTFASGDLVRIRLAYQSGLTAKEFVEVEALASGTGWSFRANQVDDAVYIANGINGSLVTGITITDSIDRMIINIAGGSVSWPQIYAYNVFWLFTAAGIVDDGAIITAKDTANYIITGFKIRNSSTVPLSITNGYGVDSATGSVASLIDVAGSVGNIYQTPDVVIAYATGSGLSPAENAQLFSLNTGAVNVESINGAEVIGNGSEANPWRGVGVSP